MMLGLMPNVNYPLLIYQINNIIMTFLFDTQLVSTIFMIILLTLLLFLRTLILFYLKPMSWDMVPSICWAFCNWSTLNTQNQILFYFLVRALTMVTVCWLITFANFFVWDYYYVEVLLIKPNFSMLNPIRVFFFFFKLNEFLLWQCI